MTPKQKQTHKIAMQVVSLLIESSLSIQLQLEVIENVREKLIFCKTTIDLLS